MAPKSVQDTHSVNALLAMEPSAFTDPFWAAHHQRQLRVMKRHIPDDYDWETNAAITEEGEIASDEVEHHVWQLHAMIHGTKEQAYDHDDY